MADIAQHSPLPWRLEEKDTYTAIVAANGRTVADNEEYYPAAVGVADQTLIVEAVNDHAELTHLRRIFADQILDSDALALACEQGRREGYALAASRYKAAISDAVACACRGTIGQGEGALEVQERVHEAIKELET